MQRLTKLDGIGQQDMIRCFGCSLDVAGENLEKCGMCEQWLKALARLVAYEDTGLEPEEIAELSKSVNEPLTLEQLKQMGGKPVYIVEHPDWGHWELAEDAEDYFDCRDPDLYGLKYDDPDGRYGLHVMGWLAFARAPGEVRDI